MLHLKGHSNDGLAIFDKKTGTLITGDCLQQYGITRFGTSIYTVEAYQQSINKVRELLPNVIVASHDYVPCGYIAKGAEEVASMLEACDEAIEKICSFADANPQTDEATLSVKYLERNPDLPKVGAHSFKAARNFLNNKKFM